MQIPIASIKSDPELQPRAVPYVEAKVEDYAIIIKAGGTLPPIEVVERDGSYTIVTGHNRLEAHKRANRQTIEVELIPDTGNSDLYWRVAAPSNSTHGAGYDEKDRKAIFARFVSEGRHRLPDGQIRSSRKIAEKLPFPVAHGTVDRWLKAHGIGSTDKRGGYQDNARVPSEHHHHQHHQQHDGDDPDRDDADDDAPWDAEELDAET